VWVKVIQKSTLVEQEGKATEFGFGTLSAELGVSQLRESSCQAPAHRMMGHGSDCAVYTFPFPLIVICLGNAAVMESLRDRLCVAS
jgi:hypothetical protein